MAERIKVVCMECGKKWSTSNLIPECPKCGAVDVEPRDAATLTTTHPEPRYARLEGRVLDRNLRPVTVSIIQKSEDE